MAKELKINIKIDAKTGKVTQVSNEFMKLDKRVRTTKKSVDGIKNKLLAIGAAVGGIYLVGKAFSFASDMATDFVKTAAQFEQYGTTLKSITGSAEEAKKSMSWIGDFTAKTPFQLAGVTEAFVKMKAYGLDPMDGTLKTLGDTASAMGKGIKQAVEAMADAVTGENERLKEFGLKAKKQGEKIAYSWADSAGKARNIIIKNSKEIIQSTLNAIFNEKYVGAMEAQSQTWNGIISNMSDQWTIFKQQFMDEGIFAYIKSLAKVISEYMRAAFGDATKASKGFSDTLVNYINNSIKAVGFLKDAISGISLAAKAVQYAVLFMSKAVMQALNAPMQAINYLIDRYNALGDVLGYQKAAMQAPTIDTTWTDSTMAQLEKEMSSIVDGLANESGQKLAEKIIGETKEGIASVNSELDELSKRKAAAKAALDALGAGYGDVAKASTKAGKSASKAAKDATKDIKLLRRGLKETGVEFADSFANAFDDMLHGDMLGSFQGFFDSIGGKMMSGFVEDMSKKLSKSLTSLVDGIGGLGSFASFGVGAALSVAGTLLGGMFGDKIQEAPDMGVTEIESKSIENALDRLYDVQYPMLELTKSMRDALVGVTNAVSDFAMKLNFGGLDFSGDNNTMGWNKKKSSYTFHGTNIDLGSGSLQAYMDNTIQGYLNTIMEYNKSGWLYDTKKFDTLKQNLPSGVMDEIGNALVLGVASTVEAAVSLGINQADIDKALGSYNVNIGKIDTTGMSEAQVADLVGGKLSEALDGFANSALSAVGEFREAGEGFYEAATRVAAEFEQASLMFDLVGKNIATWQESAAILQQSGGLSSFTANMNDFMGLFTDEKQLDMQVKALTSQFDDLGVSLPKTNEAFIAMVDGINTTSTAGATLYADLLSLSGSFGDMTAAVKAAEEAAADEAKAAADEAKAALASKLALLQKELSFHEGILSQIENAYSGTLSYLNSIEKEEYLGRLAQSQLSTGNTQSYFDTLYKQLEYGKKMSVTREDYIPKFERYIAELSKAEPETTLDDVVESNENIAEEILSLRTAISRASFQGAF